MALKFPSLHLMIFALLLAAFYLDLCAALDGYQPIEDLNDPVVQNIANFAVDQHNKEADTELSYQKVVEGETIQVVAGVNYKLVIVAEDGTSHQYEAMVSEKAWLKFLLLTSFSEVKRTL